MGLSECGFLSLTEGETCIHKHPHILSVFCQSAHGSARRLPRLHDGTCHPGDSKNKESESWRSQKKWCSSVHPHFQTQRQPLCRSTNLKQVALKMSVAALPCLLHKCLINEVPTPATAPDSWWRLVAVWQCPPPVPPSRWRFFSKTFFSFSVSNLWTCLVLSGSC